MRATVWGDGAAAAADDGVVKDVRAPGVGDAVVCAAEAAATVGEAAAVRPADVEFEGSVATGRNGPATLERVIASYGILKMCMASR